MDRPDHEHGGVLNSPDDTPEKPATQAVRRSSPLGRRSKPKPAPPADPAVVYEVVEQADAVDPAVVDPAVVDTAVVDTSAVDTSAVDTAVADVPAESITEAISVEPDADEVARNAEYRQRRRSRAVVRKSATGGAGGRDRSTLTTVAVAVTALVVVLGVVASGVFGYQYFKIKNERELRAEYSTFAQQMVVSLFTLNPENADQMYKNTMDNTSGRARQMFKDNMKNTAKMIREGDMVTKTTVVAEAVSKATSDEGSVLLVSSWQGYPKSDKKAVQSTSFRLRVDITRINGKLKMTYLDWVA